MSIAGEALDYLGSRGDVVFLSLVPTSDGRYQANRKFANAKGYGVTLASGAAKALNDCAMQTMMSYHFPDGALNRKTLPDRTGRWDPELDDLLGGGMPDLTKDLDDALDALMGHVRVLSYNLCSDGHWQLQVTWSENVARPIHWAAPAKNPSQALRDLLAWADSRGLLERADSLDAEIEDLLG